jgi:hypothetical protein
MAHRLLGITARLRPVLVDLGRRNRDRQVGDRRIDQGVALGVRTAIRSPSTAVLGLLLLRKMPHPDSAVSVISAAASLVFIFIARHFPEHFGLSILCLRSLGQRIEAERARQPCRAAAQGFGQALVTRDRREDPASVLRLVGTQMRDRHHLAGAAEPGIAGNRDRLSRAITCAGGSVSYSSEVWRTSATSRIACGSLPSAATFANCATGSGAVLAGLRRAPSVSSATPR